MAALIGITITVSDKELAKVNDGLKDTDAKAKKTEKSTSNLGSEMKRFAASIMAVHVAMKLAEKAGMLFERAIASTLAHRFENDGLLRAVKGIEQAFARVNNSAFDALAPLLKGISNTLGPLSEKFARYVKENEKLIRTNVIDWAVKAGSAIASATVTGASLALQALLYLGAGWDSVKVIVNGALAGIVNTISKFAFALAEGAKMIGDTKTQKEMALLGLEAGKLGIQFDTSGALAVASLRATSNEIGDLKKKTEDVRETILKGIKGVGVEAMKNLAMASHTTALSMDEVKASLDADLKVLERVMARRFALNHQYQAELERTAQFAEQEAQRQGAAWEESFQRQMSEGGIGGLAKAWGMYFRDLDRWNQMSLELTGKAATTLTDEQKKNLLALKEATRAGAADIVSSISFITDPWKDFIKGTASAGEAFSRMVDNIEAKIIDLVMSKAIEGLFNILIGAFTGGGLLGGVASLLGINLGKTAMALPSDNLKLSFARGGVVPNAARGYRVAGGTPGRDSVLINAMPGERVLTPQENRDWERGRSGGGGGNTTVVAEYRGFPQSQGEVDRWLVSSVVPAVRRLQKTGVWPK